MIVVGTPDCIPQNLKGNFIIYNLFTNIEGYPSLDILPRVNQMCYTSEKDFDIFLAKYIFENDIIFIEFFEKLIYPLYLGYNVFILTIRNEIFDGMVESVLKLIQQRYGYNAAIINEPDELYLANQDESFNINGIYNLDIDKERYSYIYTTKNMYQTKHGNVKIRGYD